MANLADCSCGVIHASPGVKAPAGTDASRGSWAAQREEKAAEGGKRRAARATFPAEVPVSVKGRPRVNGVAMSPPPLCEKRGEDDDSGHGNGKADRGSHAAPP